MVGRVQSGVGSVERVGGRVGDEGGEGNKGCEKVGKWWQVECKGA